MIFTITYKISSNNEDINDLIGDGNINVEVGTSYIRELLLLIMWMYQKRNRNSKI